MTTRLEHSQHSGSRDHARALVADLPSHMAGTSVVLDCSGLVVGTPSFVDEIVKEVLLLRQADRLELTGSSARVATLAESAAANRGVADRLTVVSAMAYADDELRRKIRRLTAGLQPGALRALQDATRLSPGVVKAMQDATRLNPGVVKAMQDATRLNPGVVKAMQDATGLRPGGAEALDAIRVQPGVVRALQDATRLNPGVVKALQDATKVPAQDWNQILAASRVPTRHWDALFRALRESALAAGAATGTPEWDAAVNEAAEHLADADLIPADGQTSWLVRLSVVQQLGLLVAILKLLDELGKLLTDLVGATEDLPPELRSGTQVLFATVAVLLIILDLRTKSNGG